MADRNISIVPVADLDTLEALAVEAYTFTYGEPSSDAVRFHVQKGIEAMRYAIAEALAHFDAPSDVLATAVAALRWIAQHETDEHAIEDRTECEHHFHTTPQRDARCPECFSRWWATDGSLPTPEGSYALGAVAAQALAEIARLSEKDE